MTAQPAEPSSKRRAAAGPIPTVPHTIAEALSRAPRPRAQRPQPQRPRAPPSGTAHQPPGAPAPQLDLGHPEVGNFHDRDWGIREIVVGLPARGSLSAIVELCTKTRAHPKSLPTRYPVRRHRRFRVTPDPRAVPPYAGGAAVHQYTRPVPAFEHRRPRRRQGPCFRFPGERQRPDDPSSVWGVSSGGLGSTSRARRPARRRIGRRAQACGRRRPGACAVFATAQLREPAWAPRGIPPRPDRLTTGLQGTGWPRWARSETDKKGSRWYVSLSRLDSLGPARRKGRANSGRESDGRVERAWGRGGMREIAVSGMARVGG